MDSQGTQFSDSMLKFSVLGLTHIGWLIIHTYSIESYGMPLV